MEAETSIETLVYVSENIRHSQTFKDENFPELLLSAFAKLREATISFVMSVCLAAWNDSTPTGRILIKFEI
jgi:hypothetical protein